MPGPFRRFTLLPIGPVLFLCLPHLFEMLYPLSNRPT